MIIQSATPATADRSAVNLWIDTTGNANTPKRWSGSAWVAVTDKVATDAATAAAPAAAGGVNATLLSMAYGQIGITQDCTAMVEKALRTVGKSVGDLAPGQFYQYGTTVGTPAPGDLVITAGHVGVYAGDGQVVSGGVNGNQTAVHSISWLSGASFVRVA